METYRDRTTPSPLVRSDTDHTPDPTVPSRMPRRKILTLKRPPPGHADGVAGAPAPERNGMVSVAGEEDPGAALEFTHAAAGNTPGRR